MIKYSQLMVDIETLGTNTNCPVISIGAVYFDIPTKTIGDSFEMVLDLSEQIDSHKRFADASTLKWWLNQSGAAKQVFKDGYKPVKEVLETFRAWVMTHSGSSANTTRKCFPWGNSNSFDLVILESLFKDYNVMCPWIYYNQRDLRTFREFIGGGAKVPKLEGVNHNAKDDCINQINYIFEHSDKIPNSK